MCGFTCPEKYIKRQRNRKLNAISDVKKKTREKNRGRDRDRKIESERSLFICRSIRNDEV